MLSDYWERRVGERPTGFWLTERVWEPSLAATLAGSGLRYTFLDDSQLRAAGAGLERDGVAGEPTRLSGYFLTERAGAPLALFPIDRRLRYLIPFAATPGEVVEELVRLPPGTALTYGDDGEKFGVWPHTHEWVIERGVGSSASSRLLEASGATRVTTGHSRATYVASPPAEWPRVPPDRRATRK